MTSKDLSNYHPCSLPGMEVLHGRHVILAPYDPSAHGFLLGQILATPAAADTWNYMPFEFTDALHFGHEFDVRSTAQDWIPYTILDRHSTKPLGMASYMRQRPEHGSIEVGCVAFSHELRRTIAATEAMYLMAAHVFDDLNYRRYEWKCHNENAASKQAAIRFGFQFEGVFRNDMVMKGKNRDTAWFAMTDDDWPRVKQAFQRWLDPSNFDENGQQKQSLSVLQAAYAAHPPAVQQQQ